MRRFFWLVYCRRIKSLPAHKNTNAMTTSNISNQLTHHADPGNSSAQPRADSMLDKVTLVLEEMERNNLSKTVIANRMVTENVEEYLKMVLSVYSTGCSL